MNNPRFSFPANDSSKKPSLIDASGANVGFEWIEGTLANIGTVVVAVAFHPDKAMEAIRTAGGEFDKAIGAALKSAKLGDHDSTRWGERLCAYFYCHEETLARALELIKDTLAKLNILPLAVIATGDPESRLWRQYHPASEPPPEP